MARFTDLHLDLEKRRRVLEAWVEKKRQIAVLECEALEVMVEQIGFHETDVAGNGFHRDAIYRSMVAEFSAAARIPTGSVEYAFTDALVVSTSLPQVRAAFAAGRVGAGHVREIVRESAIVAEAIRNKRVDADVMGLYEAAVLVFAERETAARTKAHAAQVAAALVGETVTDRHQRAASERCVKVRSVGDGLALLTAVLPEWLAVAIADRLRQMTRQVIRNRARARDADSGSGSGSGFGSGFGSGPACDSGSVIFSDDTFATDPDTDTDTDTGADAEDVAADTRTWDQVQADLLADLLLTADPSAAHGEGLDNIQGRIQVTLGPPSLGRMTVRRNSTDTDRSTPTSQETSPGGTPDGVGCSSTPTG